MRNTGACLAWRVRVAIGDAMGAMVERPLSTCDQAAANMELLTDWPGQLAVVGTVAIAMLLGGIIGFEREMANKPAGFRTHMLLAGAAALITGLADVLAEVYSVANYSEFLRVDPLRIVEAVVTGVAFLGAGTIFRSAGDNAVEGLTTATSLLLVSGVGIAVAMGQYLMAVGVTILTYAVLKLIQVVELRIADRGNGR
ncbi:MAG: MgtC/SapB family protein [Salinisphaera sp.]|nr:MgtC/SapB family protein [Salinisphaera sp.]